MKISGFWWCEQPGGRWSSAAHPCSCTSLAVTPLDSGFSFTPVLAKPLLSWQGVGKCLFLLLFPAALQGEAGKLLKLSPRSRGSGSSGVPLECVAEPGSCGAGKGRTFQRKRCSQSPGGGLEHLGICSWDSHEPSAHPTHPGAFSCMEPPQKDNGWGKEDLELLCKDGGATSPGRAKLHQI